MLVCRCPSQDYPLSNVPGSIKAVAGKVAENLMGSMAGDQLVKEGENWGTWWQSGVVWDTILDYSSATSDWRFGIRIEEALNANQGPGANFDRGARDINGSRMEQVANDDILWWALASMKAAELNLGGKKDHWLTLAANTWKLMKRRWEEDSAFCGGGIRWQLPGRTLPGWEGTIRYKQTISNGMFFQLSARLFDYTGEATYEEMANTIWDWLAGEKVQFIKQSEPLWEIRDGHAGEDLPADQATKCEPDGTGEKKQWTYNTGVLLFGSAVMHSKSADKARWAPRVNKLMDKAASFFDGQNVLNEPDCGGVCSFDQTVFKSVLVRSMWIAKGRSEGIKDKVMKLVKGYAKVAVPKCDDSGRCACDGLVKETCKGQGQTMAVLGALAGALT